MRRDQKIKIILVIIGVLFLYSITNTIASMFFSFSGIMIILTIAIMFGIYLITTNKKISIGLKKFKLTEAYYSWKKKHYFKKMEELRYYLKGKYGQTGKCPKCGGSITVFTVSLSKKCKKCGEKI